MFVVKKKNCKKKLLVKKKFGSKNVGKHFFVKKNFGQKIFGLKNFQSKKIWSKIDSITYHKIEVYSKNVRG